MSGPSRTTLCRGRIDSVKLLHDKLGRPYFSASVDLTWVDDPIQLMQQTQLLEVAFTVDSQQELLPLFGEAMAPNPEGER